jgi:hypothetical protein
VTQIQIVFTWLMAVDRVKLLEHAHLIVPYVLRPTALLARMDFVYSI